jgi:molybdenum cofactor cytidylyltransferase
MNVTAIVLAAGTSSRMGQPKQLMPVEGRSLVRRAAEAAIGSVARQTIVVTGAARENVEAELSGLAVMLVHNPDYAEGMSTSLRAGLGAVRPEVDAVVVLLADQPFVDSTIVDGLVDLYERSAGLIVRPRYGGVPGNPVLWDRKLFEELLVQEGDQGGRALLQRYTSEIVWLDLPDAALQTDIDTPEAYAALAAGEERRPPGPHEPLKGLLEARLRPPQHPLPRAGAGEPQSADSPSPSQWGGGQGVGPPHADEGHPHVVGVHFCGRCATELVTRPIEYDRGHVRQTCPACGFVAWADPKVAVLTVITWDGGILLGRRTQNPGKGGWSFPSGFVDRGEVVEEAARRETVEETGLEVDLTGLVGVYSAPGNPVIVIAYAAEPRGGSLRADDDLVDIRGFDPNDLPDMAFAHDERIVRDWLAHRARAMTPG